MSLYDLFHVVHPDELLSPESIRATFMDDDRDFCTSLWSSLAIDHQLASSMNSGGINMFMPERFKADNRTFYIDFLRHLSEHMDILYTQFWPTTTPMRNHLVDPPVWDLRWNDQEITDTSRNFKFTQQTDDLMFMLYRAIFVSKERTSAGVECGIRFYCSGANLDLTFECHTPELVEKWRNIVLGWIHHYKQNVIEVPPTDKYNINTIFYDNVAGRVVTRQYSRDLPDKYDTLLYNYPARIQPSLEMLLAYNPNNLSGVTGKLILFHGPPGTGKTSFTKMLAAAWSSWSDFNYVIDPEAFFGNPAYVNSVIGDDDTARMPVYVLEDMDTLITEDTKRASGGAFGKLLNLADGILGQIKPMYFLITTNEPFSKLAPAIIRDGRCLAQVSFPNFSQEDIALWSIQTGNTPPDGLTNKDDVSLASLYATHIEAVQPKKNSHTHEAAYL